MRRCWTTWYNTFVRAAADAPRGIGPIITDGADMKLPHFPFHLLGRMYCRHLCRNEFRKQDKTRKNERPVELRFVFEHLTRTCPDTVLDVGPGKSSLPHLMSICGYNVTAVDNIDDYWRAGVFNRHFLVEKDDIRSPRLTGPFDFITCVSVLEHIADHERAVASMLSLLDPGGSLVLTFPYCETRYVENVYALPEAGYGAHFPYICQVFSRAEVDGWLAANHCEIADMEFWRFFTGELWTFGGRVCPPVETTADGLHQHCCLLLRKTGESRMRRRQVGSPVGTGYILSLQ